MTIPTPRIFAGLTLLSGMLVMASACHPGPIIGADKVPSVGGTIAGTVSATDGSLALAGRTVTVKNVATGASYQVSTSVTGGYTIEVPTGTYRIDVELRPGETLAKRPGEGRVGKGDLDSGRDFVVTAGR
jgi:hypothetical protein